MVDVTRVTGGVPRASESALTRWPWARQWEFWLALALGAALRLWRLDLTQFLDDQARLMTLARASMTRGLLLVTGIPSSIHTLNPPLTVYPLLPFAAFTSDPMPAVISVAIWNIAGIALCYIFTLRYFGRSVAALSALLFATCGSAIFYSRFIWQQNYLPPLIILWALTLYLGCIDCRRGWIVTNIALLAAAASLHPTAALLAPVTLAAAFLAPRFPRLKAWVISATVLLALALPTIVWEAVSGFHDVSALRQYASGHSQITGDVFSFLYVAISGPDAAIGSSRLAFGALNILALLLFASGWVILTVRVVRPARALPWRSDGDRIATVRAWLVALYRGLREDASWRVNLLLWLSVSLPVVLMIRHSSKIVTHYLIILYPFAFIVSALGITAIAAWVEQRGRVPRRVTLAAQLAFALLLLARSAQWLTFPAALTNAATFHAYDNSGAYAQPVSMYGGYGYPLSVLQDGSAQLAALQRRFGDGAVEAIIPGPSRYRSAAEYVLAGEQSDRLTVTPDCLLLPAPSERWLITSAVPGAAAATLLASVAATPPIGALRMIGGPDYPVYQVTGPGAPVTGERARAPVIFTDGSGNALRLEGIAPLGASSMVVRWSVIAASAPDMQSRYFTINASVGSRAVATTCEAQRWRAGETLYTILPVTAGGDLRLSLQSGTDGLDIRSAGPLPTLSGLNGGQAPVAMRPAGGASGSDQPAVSINADGSVSIPPAATP